MATRPSTPTGEHMPVSNQAEEAPSTEEERFSDAPVEGIDPQTNPVTEGGMETVEEYKPIETPLAQLALAPEAAEAEEVHRRLIQELPDLWMSPDTSGLSDIGEASFGIPPPIEAVIGADDRVQITSTSTYPWRVHASLLITAADNSQWIGTGWFIGPHTLMTAGHVVFIKNSGVLGRDGWVRRITVMTGRNGKDLPYGSVSATSFRSVVGWTESGDQNFDYGAILIPTELGNTTGWLGFGVWPDADLLASIGNISGYPGDKPSGTQWYHSRRIVSVNSRKVFYDIDTAGGQSGSAVYRIVGGARYGIAVHAYGGVSTNSGTRITSPVFDNMTAWRA
jgi:glutamyl endopeptidase